MNVINSSWGTLSRACGAYLSSHREFSTAFQATKRSEGDIAYLDAKDKNSVMSSIKNSGSILKTSGVLFGKGNLSRHRVTRDGH